MIALLFTLAAAEGMQALPPPHGFAYACDGGIRLQADFLGRSARLVVGERTLDLPLARSGSGSRYSDGQATFWIKGDAARLELPGTAPVECVVTE